MNEEEFVTPTIGQGDVQQAEKDRTFEGRLDAFNEQSEALKILGSQDRWKTDWNRNLQTNVFGRGPLSPESPLLDDFSNTMETVTGVDPTDPKDIAMEALGFFQEARSIGPTATVVKRAVVNNADDIPFLKQGIKEASRKLDNWFGALRTKVQTPDGRTFYAATKDGSDDLSQRMSDAYVRNKKTIKNKQGLPEPVFHGDDILNNFPDDVNTLGTVHDLTGTHTRNEAAGLLTGNTVKEAEKLETMFNQYTKRIAETINSTLPKRIRDRLWRLDSPGRTAKWHHIGPLKQVAAAVNGLTDEAAKNGAQYIADGIGRKVGNLWGAGTPLVDEFHRKVHMLFNVGAGKTSTGKLRGYNINQHIEKLGWPDNWQQVIPHKDRKDLYDLIINDVVESETVINQFWRQLNNLVDSSKVNRKEFLNSFFETKMLDSRIKQAYNDPNVTTLTDMMQHISGQTNEALSNIVNLLGNTPKSDVMYPVLLKEQGLNALWEVLEESRKLPGNQIVPTSKIFKKYNIQLSKGQKDIVNKLIKDDDAYQHMLRSRGKNIPPADSIWNKGQDN